MRWAVLAGALTVLLAAPAEAQFSDCASIANPAARLECYDRAGRPGSRPQQFAPQAVPQAGGGACTRSSPCVGPRGGVYYYTSSGRKQYLPR